MARHWGECVARQYLETQGYELIKENYAIRGGEIDLIMKDSEVIVFVEVKQRKDSAFGGVAESIQPYKLQRLLKTALHFMVSQYGRDDLAMRFDAVLLTGAQNDYRLEHLENILQ